MYPSPDLVERASRVQLAQWVRRLPSPGTSAIGKPEFEETLEREAGTMDRILERFADMGGMTPQISKLIGW